MYRRYAKQTWGWWVWLVLPWLAACSMQQASSDQALEVVKQFQSALSAGRYDEAMAAYGDEFFQTRSRESWQQQLRQITDKLGSLQSSELSEQQINTVYSGRQFLFIFVNKYANGYATETMVLQQPVDSPAIKIVMHKLDSTAL